MVWQRPSLVSLVAVSETPRSSTKDLQILPSQSARHSRHHRPPQAKPDQPGPDLLEPRHRRDRRISDKEAQPPYPVPHRFHRHDGRLRLLDGRKRRLRKDAFPASSWSGRWNDLRLLHVLHDHAPVNLRIYHRGLPFHSSSKRRGTYTALLQRWKFVQSVSICIISTACKCV
jgi:hypothetical protein